MSKKNPNRTPPINLEPTRNRMTPHNENVHRPTQGTLLVLDELKRLNVTGTFFVNGVRIKGDAGLILTRAEQEGHVVAHHTYDHASVEGKYQLDADGNIKQSTLDYFELEIDHNIRVANPYLPLKGLRPYFRPPYLELDDGAATYLKDKYDIYVVQVNVNTFDYEKNDTANITAMFTSNIYDNHQRHSWVSLQHDEYQTTAAAIPAMVAFGREKGYRFVGIDECLGFPTEVKHVRTFAPTATPCAGDPCPGLHECRSRFGMCGATIAHCMDAPMWIPRCRIETDMPCNLNTKTPAASPRLRSHMCSGEPCADASHCRNKDGACGVGSEYCGADALWTRACDAEPSRSGAGGSAGLTTVVMSAALAVLCKVLDV
jgi:peptidoglycan/xylan/chitin deacetylase (PgdA/CDA1 family)